MSPKILKKKKSEVYFQAYFKFALKVALIQLTPPFHICSIHRLPTPTVTVLSQIMREVSEKVHIPSCRNPPGFFKLEKQRSTVLCSASKLLFHSDMPE